MALLRAVLDGDARGRSTGRHYTLPADVLCLPTPAHHVPVLVGGHSKPALRRAGAIGDGWLGQQSLGALDTGEIRRERAARRPRAGATAAQVVLRIVESAGRSAELAPQLPRARGGGRRRGHRRRRLGRRRSGPSSARASESRRLA